MTKEQGLFLLALAVIALLALVVVAGNDNSRPGAATDSSRPTAVQNTDSGCGPGSSCGPNGCGRNRWGPAQFPGDRGRR